MAALIEELRREHELLLAALQEVGQAGIGTPQAARALHRIKALLLAHLRKEDERLYPRLEAAARTDPTLADLLAVFARDMQEVTAVALAFFEKRPNGGGGFGYAREWGTVAARLRLRIASEESGLYAEYERRRLDRHDL